MCSYWIIGVVNVSKGENKDREQAESNIGRRQIEDDFELKEDIGNNLRWLRQLTSSISENLPDLRSGDLETPESLIRSRADNPE